jgi:predicted DCC family thiol-disulfide oxidoreductase YuxK
MKQSVICYDSTCLMCSKTVGYVLKHDSGNCFVFTSLNGTFAGQRELPAETVVVVTPENTILIKHKAIRYIASKIPSLRWLEILMRITPNILQLWGYVLVARYRKRIYGSTSCPLQTNYSNRFIP